MIAADAAPIAWLSIIRTACAALSVLDILPTAEHFQRTDMAFAMGYWHWFFLAQPYRSSGAPDQRGSRCVSISGADARCSPTQALAEYRRCFYRSRDDPRHVRGLSRRRRQSTCSSTWPIKKRSDASCVPCRRCGGSRDSRNTVRRARDLARLGRRVEGQASIAATISPRKRRMRRSRRWSRFWQKPL